MVRRRCRPGSPLRPPSSRLSREIQSPMWRASSTAARRARCGQRSALPIVPDELTPNRGERMNLSRNLICLVPAVIVAVATACGGNETQAPEDHTPVSYNILVDGTAVSAPYTLVAGETARVQIKFFNAAQ